MVLTSHPLSYSRIPNVFARAFCVSTRALRVALPCVNKCPSYTGFPSSPLLIYPGSLPSIVRLGPHGSLYQQSANATASDYASAAPRQHHFERRWCGRHSCSCARRRAFAGPVPKVSEQVGFLCEIDAVRYLNVVGELIYCFFCVWRMCHFIMFYLFTCRLNG